MYLKNASCSLESIAREQIKNTIDSESRKGRKDRIELPLISHSVDNLRDSAN